MRLTVVGCSGSFPGPESPASCYLVEAAGFRLLLDLGNGSLGMLQRFAGLETIDAVLLSHLHPDHCLDMCSYHVARSYRPGGRLPRLPVYGPRGTGQRLAAAYDPSAHTGLSTSYEFLDLRPGRLDIGPFDVRVDRVNHPVETFGVRIEQGGSALAYSGDSGASRPLVELARDVDLFLCEASFLDGDPNPPNLHLTGRQAGEHAAQAGVGRLVVTHVPPWNDAQRTLGEASSAVDDLPVELARTGSAYDV